MPKINHEEYEILKELDDKWKWIARDKDGTLVMGAGKNERYLDGWFPPENIGDSLVADEINAVKVISEWGNLFQFIQWEDEAPYNIQELIEEYLYDNQPKLFIDGQEQSFEFIEESEETEVKKQKLIEKWESAIGAAEFYGRGKEDRLIEYMRNFVDDLNQLDEPEVLSQKWISENVEYAYFDMLDGSGRLSSATAIIKPEKLQNLLVPKQELPVIPKFVAEWIKETKPYNSLRVAFEYIAQRKRDNHDDELALWVEEGNSEAFARAWLDGYEIEQEPKYYALIKGHENIYSGICFWIYDTEIEELLIDNAEIYPDVTAGYMIKATKDEWASLGINDDNADFVKIEELEK